MILASAVRACGDGRFLDLLADVEEELLHGGMPSAKWSIESLLGPAEIVRRGWVDDGGTLRPPVDLITALRRIRAIASGRGDALNKYARIAAVLDLVDRIRRGVETHGYTR